MKDLTLKFTRKFIDTEYKNHRQQVLLERERSLLPATQAHVEEIKKRKVISCEIQELKKRIKELQEEVRVREAMLMRHDNAKQEEKPKVHFVRKCPNGECRGFVNSQWTCGLCNVRVCSECHEIKGDDEHECKPENRETAKLLAKDTKPCPKCATLIFKINGCDQMWCTQCHTAFSWRTGNIESNTIHNPHYFEYLRKTGRIERNPADVQCGRQLDNWFVQRMHTLQRQHNFPAGIIEICRLIIHMREVHMPNFRRDNIRDNLDLRTKYLMDEIDEQKLKKMLQIREKNSSKKHEISNILGMVVASATDIMYRFVEEMKYEESMTEFNALREYVNECFRDVASVYKCKEYEIDPVFRLR